MYINKKQLKGFKTYKYSCIDNGPIAVYIVIPIWRFFGNYIPEYIAPNTLTLTGFIFSIMQFILLSYYDPTFNAQSSGRIRNHAIMQNSLPNDGSTIQNNDQGSYDIEKDTGLPGKEIPAFIWFACAFMQFLSYAADGVDGIQARKTGTSSPLGEMMDHGIDAWSCSFIMMSLFSCIGASEDYTQGLTMVDMFLMVWLLQCIFFCSHWEKLVTGTLVLPWSLDASICGLIILYITVGFVGSGFWLHKIPFTNLSFLMTYRILFYILATLTFTCDSYKICKVYLAGNSKRPLSEIIIPWISPLLGFGIFALWVFAGPYPQSVNLYQPRVVLLGCGALFGNIIGRVLIYQMSNTSPSPIINPGIFLLFFFFILDKFVIHHAYITTIIWPVCTVLLILMQLHFGYSVIYQFSDFLNIYPFSVRKRVNDKNLIYSSNQSKYTRIQNDEEKDYDFRDNQQGYAINYNNLDFDSERSFSEDFSLSEEQLV